MEKVYSLLDYTVCVGDPRREIPKLRGHNHAFSTFSLPPARTPSNCQQVKTSRTPHPNINRAKQVKYLRILTAANTFVISIIFTKKNKKKLKVTWARPRLFVSSF